MICIVRSTTYLFSFLIQIFSPEIWRDTMSVLQDQCPTQDFKTIKEIVSKEVDFDEVFASFEEEPIGAASIGQGTVDQGSRLSKK